jgi:hypothetical protein
MQDILSLGGNRLERWELGGIRKVPLSQGFAWEFRFYSTAAEGKRKLDVPMLESLYCQRA